MKTALRIEPLDLHEGGVGYQVVDESGEVIFDNQTYYPSAPSEKWAELIVAAVNAMLAAREVRS